MWCGRGVWLRTHHLQVNFLKAILITDRITQIFFLFLSLPLPFTISLPSFTHFASLPHIIITSLLLTYRQEMSNGTTTLTVSGVKVSTKECIAADNTCQTFSDGLMEQRYNHTKSENTKSTRSFTMTEC